ncbi:MAG: hypothetical protein ACR2QH_05880 [Geminicoccaceae bacterium]
MSKPRSTSVDDLSLDELRGLVVELLARVSALAEENAALKDEVARLRGLKGRPKLKPSGMEKATSGTKAKTGCKRTKRKRHWSETGRDARDVFLALMKTSQKLDVSFFHFPGKRLDVPGAPIIPPLPNLVSAAQA